MVHEKKRGRSVTTLFFCYVVWEVIECPITPSIHHTCVTSVFLLLLCMMFLHPCYYYL